MCTRTKRQLPAGIWAPIVAIMMVVVAAGLSADIINKELNEAPTCAI